MKLQMDQLARQKEELAQMVAEQKQLNKLLLTRYRRLLQQQ